MTTALAKPLAARTLAEHNERLREIRAAGEELWTEAAAIFWDVWAGEKWKRAKGTVFENFEEWAKSQGYQKSHAYRLKDAGERLADGSPVGETERETRALIETERTEKRVRDMSADEALDESGKQRDRAAEVARQLEWSAWVKDVECWAAKGRKLFQRQVGTEKAGGIIDRLLAIARDVAA